MVSPQHAHGLHRIGEYLPCSATDIERALAVQAYERSAGNLINIGEILVARELVTSEILRAALDKQRIDRLYRSSLLARLSEEQMILVGGISEEIGLSVGETLFTQGCCGDSLYVVTSGRILLSRQKPSGENQPIAVALPGDVLGEVNYFSKMERSCTAWAIEPAMLLKIRYELLSSPAGLARNFSAHLAKCHSAPLGPLPGVDTNKWVARITGRIAIRVCRTMQVDSAYIFIREPDSGDFLTYAKGPGGYRRFRLGSDAGIFSEMATARVPIQLTDPYFDPRFTADIDVWTGQWTRSLMAGPIRNSQGALVGALQVINKANGTFDRDDETVFRAVARQFAPTIQRCGTHLAKSRPTY